MYIICKNISPNDKLYLAHRDPTKHIKLEYRFIQSRVSAMKFESIRDAEQYIFSKGFVKVCIEPFIAPKMATIYSLSHPINGNIFYVGSTKNKLKVRACKRYKCKTAQEIYSLGLIPIAEQIECCSQDVRRETEIFWIQQMKAWGFNLENKHYNNKFFLSTMRIGERRHNKLKKRNCVR